jgi:hypothetical protein
MKQVSMFRQIPASQFQMPTNKARQVLRTFHKYRTAPQSSHQLLISILKQSIAMNLNQKAKAKFNLSSNLKKY